MSKINFKENSVYVVEKKVVRFSSTIAQMLENNNQLYILLDIPTGKDLNFDDFHNVYCYSVAGEKVWQIGNRKLDDEVVYTMINMKDDKLYANDFLGRRYNINKDTGLIDDDLIITK